jgi:hypothetical protein
LPLIGMVSGGQDLNTPVSTDPASNATSRRTVTMSMSPEVMRHSLIEKDTEVDRDSLVRVASIAS